MTLYLDTIEIMLKKITEFIKRLEDMDEKDPFTYTIIEHLKDILQESYNDTKNIVQKLKPQELSYRESFDSLSREYEKKEAELEVTLNEDIKKLRDKYHVKRTELRDDIEAKKNDVKMDENNVLMDIEFFFIASEQNVELFEREYTDNISRYSYQLGVAKESYSQNTILFNEALDNDLAELERIHNKILSDYDKDTERIIEHYRKNEDELNRIYNQKVEEFTNLQNDNKNLKRQESMELNNKIRVLVNDRNEKILQARQEYAKKQAEAQSEKDARRQEFQTENQKITREFIANMGSLDDKTLELKKTFTERTDQEKRELQYKLLELKNEEEKLLQDIYSSSIPSKKDAKNIKSQYYKYSTLEKKNTDKTLRNISNSYLVGMEQTHYEKMLLDLDRNYDIKSVLEHETYNNKIFQENNNEYENEMNLQIKIHNLEYNNAANKIRTENTLKILKDEKDFDEIEALHTIEIEKLLCQIKSIKYEIESFEEIRALLHNFEDKKYQLTSNFKTVNNVLEIEKCKALDALNKSMFEINTKSVKMVFDAAKESASLKNKEYEDKCLSVINRNKLILNNEVKQLEYKIECLRREEEYQVDILNRNYFYELDTLGHKFLSDKFILEFKRIMQHLSMLTQLVRRVEHYYVTSLDYVIKNINVRPEYFQLIRQFVRELTNLSFEECNRFLGNFHFTVDEIIQERLEFEESLKYKGFYKNIEGEYKEVSQYLNNKKEAIIKDIDNLNNMVENNKTALFSIDNELFLKKKKMKNDDIPYKVFKNDILTLNSERKEIELDNQKNYKKILVLTRELSHLDNQHAQINLSYTRQQDEIRKMQITNAQSYYELKRNLDRLLSVFVGDMNSRFRIIENQDYNFTEYTLIVKQKVNANILGMMEFEQNIYSLINKFSTNERTAITKSAEILDNGYLTDLSELERDYKNNSTNAKNTFSREEANRLEELNKFDQDADNRQKAIRIEMQEHENLVKEYTNNIQIEMSNANQTFYDDYYSICSNQQDIIDMQELNMKIMTEEYEKNRATIFERFKRSKEQLKSSLSEYIISQNEVLKHLPTAVKEQEKSINDEANKKKEDMEQDYLNIRLEDTATKKEIKKNKSLIDAAFFIKQEEMDKEHRANRLKEKKNHQSQMRHLSQ